MRVTNDNFPEVFVKYKKDVYAISYNYLLNIDDANDMLQDTFIKLLSGNDEFDDEEHLKAWLIRVCINLCKNKLRSRKHATNEELTEEIPYTENFEANELLKEVLKLPEKYRIPLHLFYYESYQVKEIAKALGMPEATVKIRLRRGREKLKETLKKEDWSW